MTIVSAVIGSLMFGASGYFAGYMMGASKYVDEIEDRQTAAIQNTAAARNSRNVRQSVVGFPHANLTRDLPTVPSAFERLGTLKAEADPLADIERDLRETGAVIADLTEQVAQGEIRQGHAQADDQSTARSPATQGAVEATAPLRR
jgi:hypothetical protein